MEHNTGGLVQINFPYHFRVDFLGSSRSFSENVTYILPYLFEDDFAIPQVGYVSSLEGIHPGDSPKKTSRTGLVQQHDTFVKKPQNGATHTSVGPKMLRFIHTGGT